MKQRIVAILLISFGLIACSSTPRFGGKSSSENVLNSPRRFSSNKNNSSKVLETQVGMISYYAEKFNGKPTYSGEIYDMNGISAAHPSYPMGTIVRVTNLNNGKQIVLKINDRMPYRNDRIMDLSLGAAEKLGFIESGITKAKIEVLKWGNGKK